MSFQMLDQSYFHTTQFSSIEHKKRFIDYNFFSCGNRKKLSLSSYRNMMILQILSHKSCLYDKRLPSYDIFCQFYPPKTHFGGLLAPKGSNSPKPIFFEVLAYLAGFKNYTFFKFFFHSTPNGTMPPLIRYCTCTHMLTCNDKHCRSQDNQCV